MTMRYRFSHVSDDGKTYYWYSDRIPGDSRVEQIKCSKEWFWKTHSESSPPATPSRISPISITSKGGTLVKTALEVARSIWQEEINPETGTFSPIALMELAILRDRAQRWGTFPWTPSRGPLTQGISDLFASPLRITVGQVTEPTLSHAPATPRTERTTHDPNYT